MLPNFVKNGLCVMLLSASAALGVAACGSAEPADDEILEVEATEPQSATDADEAIGNPDQLQCTGAGNGAHCLTRCCNNGAWSDLGNPGWGHCSTAASNHCKGAGGPCEICWGHYWW